MAPDEVARSAQGLRVSVDWSDAASVPATPLNQFVCQVGAPLRDGRPDGIYLTLGTLIPPLVLGDTPEERQHFIDMAKAGARVQVHGRYALSRERLDEFIDALQGIANIYDSVVEAAKVSPEE
jgi:hypothetical protein